MNILVHMLAEYLSAIIYSVFYLASTKKCSTYPHSVWIQYYYLVSEIRGRKESQKWQIFFSITIVTESEFRLRLSVSRIKIFNHYASLFVDAFDFGQVSKF